MRRIFQLATMIKLTLHNGHFGQITIEIIEIQESMTFFKKNPMGNSLFLLVKIPRTPGCRSPRPRLIVPWIPPQLRQAPHEGAELRGAETAEFPCR